MKNKTYILLKQKGEFFFIKTYNTNVLGKYKFINTLNISHAICYEKLISYAIPIIPYKYF